MQLATYLFFDGRCEEAIKFYEKAIGAKVGMLMRFGEGPPEANPSPESKDKVLHAALTIGGTPIFASDGMNKGKPNFDGFSLSLTAANDAEAEKLFTALGEGGTVSQPMIATFFASRFGMVKDKFGVNWMVLTPKPQ